MEKKIFLDKNDDLNKAVDLLISDSADKIILNIPKNSVLGLSVHNFQVLERESETAGKELVIESVDEKILDLASLATIPSVNPVFKTKERVVTDVLPPEADKEEKPAKKTRAGVKKTEEIEEKKPKQARVRKKKETPIKISSVALKEEEEGLREPIEMMEDIVPKRESEEVVEYVPDPKMEEKMKKKSGRGARFWTIVVSTLVIVATLGYFAVVDILPKVTINVSIRKTTVPFSSAVILDVDNSVPAFSGDAISLPGQLSTAKNNLNMSFPATGSSTVSTKAGGTLSVFNAYSAQAQTLVVNTRFESPEGKIFRLVKRVAIPGAKIANGKTTPSSIEVQVIADQPGPEYNVPPSEGWKIPGFKGTPRYDKFYAEAKTSMTGGSSGNQIIPTPGDIKQAKGEIEDVLKNSLKSQTLILNSQNLKLFDDASAFNVTSENISSVADKDGNFSIFAAGELKQMVFDERMLRDAIVKLAATSTSDVKIDDFSMNYSTNTVDLALGKMTFSVSGTLVYEPRIDFDAFKNEILGYDANALKAKIFALPDLEKANISFWPFWVDSVPKRGARVNIVVE